MLELDDEDWQGWLLHGNVSERLRQFDVARSSWHKAADEASPVKELALEALKRVKRRL